MFAINESSIHQQLTNSINTDSSVLTDVNLTIIILVHLTIDPLCSRSTHTLIACGSLYTNTIILARAWVTVGGRDLTELASKTLTFWVKKRKLA